jgi:RHS repeat-associated protein
MDFRIGKLTFCFLLLLASASASLSCGERSPRPRAQTFDPAPQTMTATREAPVPAPVAAGVDATGVAVLADNGPQGGSCASSSDCASGFCVNGVCCDSACTDQQCNACNLPGLVGTCSPKSDGAACSASDLCVQGAACQAGTCGGGSPVVCATDTCHPASTCEPTTGACLSPYVASASCPFVPVTFVDPPDGQPESVLYGINDTGSAVGWSFSDGAPYGLGYLDAAFYTSGGSSVSLPAIGTADRLYPTRINSSGFIMATGNDVAGNDYGRTVLFRPDLSYTMPIRVFTRPEDMTEALAANGEPSIAGAIGVSGGPFGLWHLDGDTKDASNNPWVRNDLQAPETPAFVTGRVGQALQLSGGPGLTETTVYPLGANPFGLSISAWVKPTGSCPASPAVILQSGSYYELALTCGAGGATALAGAVNTTYAFPLPLLPAVGSLTVGEWNHVAMTWNESFVRFYVNGQKVGETAAPGTLLGYTQDITMGANFTGALDEVALFGSPLSGFEVAQLNAGNVGGLYQLYSSTWFRHSNGETEVVAPPAGASSGSITTPYSINDAGDMVGTATLSDGQQHALIFTDADGIRDLNALLPAGSGWFLTHAMQINNHRQIVGRGDHAGQHRMFRFDLASGEMRDLGVLPYPNDNAQYFRIANDINDAGHVVGASYDQWPAWAQRAVVYTDALGLTDLNTMIDPTSGLIIREAFSINNNDEVVGWASDDMNTRFQAFKMKLGGQAVGSCIGKPNGTACSDANSCTVGDTCQNEVCTTGTCQVSACGADMEPFCLRADGVVDLGDGRFVAVFGHDSGATTTIQPQSNEVLLDGVIVSNPVPAPPQSLVPGTKLGEFLPTFNNGHTITWSVDGQTATASASSPHLTKVPIGNLGFGVMIGGQLVPIEPDPYMTPPQDPIAGQEPDTGTTEFNGALTGKLSVSPTGAAIYSVPIAVPPAVAGMAPNLSLVYNSQGGDGIAGQGWDLGGLSMIARCPKTRAMDGKARPVQMTPLQIGADSDGLCLDGKRLVEIQRDPLTYYTDLSDGSTISRSSDFSTFTVVTKSGETRYYASRPDDANSLVSLSGQPVIWALDRVVDTWGNYYDLNYYDDPLQNGIRAKEIDYTGHLPAGSSTPDVTPFAYVRFTYDSNLRPDVRTIRFRNNTIPKNQRLTAIDTGIITTTGTTIPRGTYGLVYQPDTPALPSRLQEIDYCAPVLPSPPPPASAEKKCLKPLQFGWTIPQQLSGSLLSNTLQFWQANSPNDEYAYPPDVTPPDSDPQSAIQFVDLNGDGRPELVFAPNLGFDFIWKNTGHGWSQTWDMPTPLADQNHQPLGVRFADVDGDGLRDIIRDNVDLACTSAQSCRACVVGEVNCPVTRHASPAVWLNRLTTTGTWEYHSEFESHPVIPSSFCPLDPNIQFSRVNTSCVDTLADWDNDGRVDVVRIGQGSGFLELRVLLNLGVGRGWQLVAQDPDPTKLVYVSGGVDFSAGANYHVEDVDRDGLPDLVSRDYFSYPDGHVEASEAVVSNQGIGGTADAPTLTLTIANSRSATPGGTETSLTQLPSFADIDGDGYYDAMLFYRSNANTLDVGRAIGMGDGVGVGYGNQMSYLSVLNDFAPHGDVDPSTVLPGDFGWALVDANGDGLIDLVRNHELRSTTLASGATTETNATIGLGELLVNTGNTWKEIDGLTAWQIGVSGTHTVPAVPDERLVTTAGGNVNLDNGSMFVDLNGDGLPDLIQRAYPRASHLGATEQVETIPSHAYLNAFTPPLITQFPNQLVNNSEVSYTVITSEDAQPTDPSAGPATYVDSLVAGDGLRLLSVPLRVVKTTSQDTGRATLTTTYQYKNLRASAFGYGPQGFESVTTTEDLTGTVTTTTYSQAYPYTGMPIQVTRNNQGPLTATLTIYCTHNADRRQNPDDDCFLQKEFPRQYAPGTAFFVRPVAVSETSYLRQSINGVLQAETSPSLVETDTEYTYDNYGNPTMTRVTITGMGESYQKETDDVYGPSGSVEQSRGLVTDTTVKTTKLAGAASPPRTHHTTFRYSPFGNPDSRGLAEKTVEPGSLEAGVEIHTAYDYDQFGNVTSTTDCAGAMESGTCAADADPSFRTTQVSYTVGILPVGVSYGDGRFPTKTINAEGHTEFTAYEPRFGLLSQKTGPNGIKTCHDYDALGNETTTTARCGSTNPLVTTMRRFVAPAPPCQVDVCQVPDEKVVTVTRPPGASPTWVFTNGVGQTLRTLAFGFDGNLVQTSTEYDSLGRVQRTSKPFLAAGGTPYWTTTTYDVLGRPVLVTQDLGVIDGSLPDGSPTANQAVLSTSYLGAQVTTERHVNGEVRQRSEYKNALGKVAAVTDAIPSDTPTFFTYDVDGNLVGTLDPLGNTTTFGYDSRGRKTLSIDPDMGTWQYTYDGYGDLATQTDAKQQLTTMTYDHLGRMTTKDEGAESGKAQWVYDIAQGAGIGKLAAVLSPRDSHLAAPCNVRYTTQVSYAETDGNRTGRSFTYTQFGDVADVSECIDGETFLTSNAYDDSTGRQVGVTYPQVGTGNPLAVGYHYTNLGFLHYVFDQTDKLVYWAAKAVNPLGQVTDEYTRNGVESASRYNPSTGWMLSRSSTAHADADNLIQSWTYRFDEGGSVRHRTRADQLTAVTTDETFGYDPLDRLTSSQVTTSDGYNQPEIFTYDQLGNFNTKAGKQYTYTGCSAGARPAGPHAVCAVDGAGGFAYDDNGNMISGSGRSVTYNILNKPIQITGDGGNGAEFIYGADGDRVVQNATSGSGTARTLYIGMGATGKSLYERTTSSSGQVEHVQFIYAAGVHGGSAFALRMAAADGSTSAMKYYHFDHLGSVTAMSDERGHVVSSGADATVMNYDPWGLRRDPDGRPAMTAFNLQTGRREFTGHETITGVGLVNMNGRVYDPVLGRFLSPDPNVQVIGDQQSYNRYTYVTNNPLRYADPTGYFWTQFGRDLANYFKNPMNDVQLVVTAFACAAGPAMCFAWGVEMALLNATVAIADGAPVGQTLVMTGVGLTLGALTFGASAEGVLNSWEGMAAGEVSAVVTNTVSNVLNGQSLGKNMFEAAAMSAVTAGVGFGLQLGAKGFLSLASAAEAERPSVRIARADFEVRGFRSVPTVGDVTDIMSGIPVGRGPDEPEPVDDGNYDFHKAADAARYAATHRNLIGIFFTQGFINITEAMDDIPGGADIRNEIWTEVSANIDKTGQYDWHGMRQAESNAFTAHGLAPVPFDRVWYVGAALSALPGGGTIGPFLLKMWLGATVSPNSGDVPDPMTGWIVNWNRGPR